MHENERATAARRTCRYPLLLALTWASTAAAQAPAGAAKPAVAPAAAAPAAAAPAAAANAPAAAKVAPPASGSSTASSSTASSPTASSPAAGSAASAPKAKRKLPLRACPARVPEDLNPPPHVTLETVLPASGVQSYACVVDKPGEAPDWAPKGPHATLGEANHLMGIHFGGPSWQAMDGSLVKGTKISSAGAPDKSAIAWLLLSGAATGEGIFGKITHIQRMDTVGGKPPQGGCDANHLDTRVLVPYRTNYYFYRESEPGEKVRQCRGTPSKQAAGDKAENKAAGSKAAGSKAAGEKAKEKSSSSQLSGDKPAGDKASSKPAPEKSPRSTAGSAAPKAAPPKATQEKTAPAKATGEKPAGTKSE